MNQKVPYFDISEFLNTPGGLTPKQEILENIQTRQRAFGYLATCKCCARKCKVTNATGFVYFKCSRFKRKGE